MIYELLKQGEQNATSSRELCRLAGLKNNRTLQSIIEQERAAGKLILSTCRNGGGYFSPSDGELGFAEIRSFVATLNSRAVNTQRALTAARQALEDGEANAK